MIGTFIKKETKHIFRDARTVMILFGMPVVMMLIFGFALTTDVKDVRVALVTSSMDNVTQRIVDRINASEYFDVTVRADTTVQAKDLIRRGKADMALVFSNHFAGNMPSHGAAVQIITDGTDPNTSIQQANYARQIIMAEGGVSADGIVTNLLYNPQMKSAYNFVPGIMGLLLLIVCAMMTSVSIVREKERGMMEVLLVSPVKPLLIIVAKAVPYMALSIVVLAAILAIAHWVLGVPIAGGVLPIFAVSLLYILLALSLGLFISVMVNKQIVAMLASGLLLLFPSMLLSGMIYPVESMPFILQYVSCLVPARWYIDAVRKLMIMGVGIGYAWKEIVVLLVMTGLMLVLALVKFKKRLE